MFVTDLQKFAARVYRNIWYKRTIGLNIDITTSKARYPLQNHTQLSGNLNDGVFNSPASMRCRHSTLVSLTSSASSISRMKLP